MADTRTTDQTRTAGAQMDDGQSKGQLTTPQQPKRAKPLTIKEQRQVEMQNLFDAVKEQRADLTNFLKPFGVDFDYFFSALRVAMMKTMQTDASFFSEVEPSTFFEALFRCALHGLLPDGKEAAIVRFKQTASFMPMRDGYVKVMHRTGMIRDINDGIVTKREDELGRFEYEEGSNGFIKHKPLMDRDEKTDEIAAVYCLIHTVNGGEYREVVPKADLLKIAKVNKAERGPRVDWAFEMHRKAALRRIVKKLPKEKALSELLAHDDLNYDLTLINAADRPAPVPIPKGALFADTAHHRREAAPMLEGGEPKETPKEAKEEPQQSDDTGETRQASKAVVDAVSALLKTESLPDLAAVIHDLKAVPELAQENVTQGEIDWIEDTIAKQTAKLKPAEDRPALVATLSSEKGEQVYEDAGIWMHDILTRLGSLKNGVRKAFWKKNLPNVLHAKQAGHEHEADRILQIAAGKRLPTEVVDG